MALGLARVELSLVVETDRGIRALNASHRKIDRPTDVLSFPQLGPRPTPHAPRPILGDVVISLDTARRQAAERGASLSDELRRLLAHGLLHLCGHDHHAPRAAARMARAEERLLGRAGMVREAAMADTPRRWRSS